MCLLWRVKVGYTRNRRDIRAPAVVFNRNDVIVKRMMTPYLAVRYQRFDTNALHAFSALFAAWREDKQSIEFGMKLEANNYGRIASKKIWAGDDHNPIMVSLELSSSCCGMLRL
jgi:hypothetical protein